MGRLLIIGVFLFKSWMFYDAVKRDVATRWFWIIPFVPGGAFIYLLMVKLRAPDAGMLTTRVTEALRTDPTVAEVQREFDTTPSLLNRIRLGQALYDAEAYEDARQRFTEALAQRPNDKDALYGIALSRLELGDALGAVEPLEKLIDLGRRYRDYAAWRDLARALWESGHEEKCLVHLDRLVAVAPRPEHQFMRASYLERAGRVEEARIAHAEAKQAEADIPEHLRRGHRPWVVNARSIMRSRGGG